MNMINYKVFFKSIGEVLLTIIGYCAAIMGAVVLVKNVDSAYIITGGFCLMLLTALSIWVYLVYNSKMKKLKSKKNTTHGGMVL